MCDLENLEELAEVMMDTSLCGLGADVSGSFAFSA